MDCTKKEGRRWLLEASVGLLVGCDEDRFCLEYYYEFDGTNKQSTIYNRENILMVVWMDNE